MTNPTTATQSRIAALLFSVAHAVYRLALFARNVALRVMGRYGTDLQLVTVLNEHLREIGYQLVATGVEHEPEPEPVYFAQRPPQGPM